MKKMSLVEMYLFISAIADDVWCAKTPLDLCCLSDNLLRCQYCFEVSALPCPPTSLLE